MYQHSRRKPRRTIRRIILALAIVCSFYLLWANAATTNPTLALSSARKLIAEAKYKQAEPLLSIAKQESAISSWAAVSEGRMLEETKKYKEAAKVYGEVPTNSPASLSSRLALIRLHEHTGVDIPGSVLSKLEYDIVRFNRRDLLPELALLQAGEAERAKDLEVAYGLYKKVRNLYPRSEQAQFAKGKMQQLQLENPKILPGNTVAALLDESKMLLAEGEAIPALDHAQKAKQKAVEKSPAYLEALVLEEKALRKMKRNEEADHVLLLISADGGAEVADVALLKIAKNAWNINDHHRALEFLSKLKERFPNSKLLEEVQYIEARILEEMKLLPEAKDSYKALAKAAADGEYKGRALKRLAWLYYQNQSLIFAAKTFQDFISLSEQRSKTLESKKQELSPRDYLRQKDQLESDYNHGAFWLATILSKIDAPTIKNHGLDAVSAAELYNSIRKNSPLSFYSLQATKALGNPPKLISGTQKQATSCEAPVDEQLNHRLAFLNIYQLRDLARYEIEWYALEHLVDNIPSSVRNIISERPLTLRELKGYTTISDLLIKSKNSERGIGLAQTLLKAIDNIDIKKEEIIWACQERLEHLSFPTPLEQQFNTAAEKNKLPPSLLYALSRTESHFNPHALSRAGASGLTQLMPATAKQQGWDGKSDLNEPALNLALGASFLSKLISNYDGQAVYAIAAYNAGSSPINRWKERNPNLNVSEWIETIGYPETYNYVQRVLVAQAIYEQLLSQRTKAEKQT